MKGRICLLLYIITCHSCLNEKTHVNQIIDEISIYENQDKETSNSIDIDNKEVIDLYNSAKSKSANYDDTVDAKVVKELDPEEVLSA